MPKLWRRYVDDILEIIPEGTTQQLTDHPNTVDPTQSIKFTHEEEINGNIPLLNTSITRKADGSVKLHVYRKIRPTPTSIWILPHSTPYTKYLVWWEFSWIEKNLS